MEAMRTAIFEDCWLRPSTKWALMAVTTMGIAWPLTFSVTPFLVWRLAWRTPRMASASVVAWAAATLATPAVRASEMAGSSILGSCRNIKVLFPLDPPTTDEEIRAAALQFVRKISGRVKPSKGNEGAFERAVEEVAEAAGRMLRALETKAPARTREEEAERARARFAARQR